MSVKIDPREVLGYLNELGYKNITAQQLKDFIKDLQKIIKYETRYGDSINEASFHQLGYQKNNFSDKENQHAIENTIYTAEQSQDIIKDYDTCKKTRNTEKYISVHILNRKNPPLDHEHCVHIKGTDTTNKDIYHMQIVNHDKVNSYENHTKSFTKRSSVDTVPPYTNSLIQPSFVSSGTKKSKVTFIRPAASKPSYSKSDPVALYHYYQSEWKRSNIPGENNRDDLRWAIREKMLGGPRVQFKTRINKQRKNI